MNLPALHTIRKFRSAGDLEKEICFSADVYKVSFLELNVTFCLQGLGVKLMK